MTIVLPVPLPSKHFGAYYSSRKNASGAALLPSSNLFGAPTNRGGMFGFGCRLRAELAASTAREAALREMLEPLPAPASVPTEKDVFGDDEDDSEPMDLATPLQPTVLLNPEDL